ncbi:MAG: hypothetical protein ACJ749_02540 [Flavisolibacter sp.]
MSEEVRVKASKSIARKLLKAYPADYMKLPEEDMNGLLKLIRMDLDEAYPEFSEATRLFIMDWVMDAINDKMIQAILDERYNKEHPSE